MKPVLVTGATGFLGSWLCRILAGQGERVIAVARRPPPAEGPFRRFGLTEEPNVRVLERPALTPDDMAAADPRAVFHLAGYSQMGEAARDVAGAFEANARGTWLLLDAIRRAGVAPVTVLASSDAVYGEGGSVASREDDPPRARNPYALSKIAAEAAALAFAAGGLPVAIARIGNVYGPGDPNGARLMPAIVQAVAAGRPPQLRSAASVRGYLHVRDCIAGLLALASDRTSAPGNIVNIVSEKPVSNLDVARLALSIAGRTDLEPEIVGTDAPSERLSSAGKARELYRWRETVPLANGLRELLEENPA
ncbi:MAG: NAD-dependent epimerase/dehydratase family protein [Pseudochelatococcus sp.]|uniref:NAD-dependent epimerase/dehydratase family protein n=1 Tax=Pseudochelatococcus sp. TaxID=2020869 RepID=UPI003D912518